MPIEVAHLSHIYGKGTPFAVEAVKDVSFTLQDGEFLGIIGHTGSGKSTLAQYLNGLTLASEGTVTVDGMVLDQNHDRKAVRTKVGMVFQYPEYQLFEETVRKDVCFGPRNMGFSEEEQERRAEHALSMMGLSMEEIGDQSPFALSGGQKRRVAIAGILAMEPRYLVLDEPTAGLDPLAKAAMLDLIRRLHRESGITVAMISHNMEDVALCADRILVMDRGRAAMLGEPEEVFSRGEELRAMGLDVPMGYRLVEALYERGLRVPYARSREQLAGNIVAALKGGNGHVG
ncbi:energy-coupling factor transporter ATPase [Christensenella sp. MSJ-20]|uniref:energy-coupling factor transporter ATPase n=1 Tax=Christensenella sp. MSJ-20 TaxID=2841518 RepID=UPI000D797FFC|nr:MAG: energy-coupling factor transporter ATPase [Bacillota bacterium]QWT55144.1 energy-coupling factor transporter ATPase [Christensenella sp. MSJ-20]